MSGPRRCGTCRHFQQAETVTNAMRLFGPEKVEVRDYCMWTPPVPFWAKAPDYLRPGCGNETLQRRRQPEDGVLCATWEEREA